MNGDVIDFEAIAEVLRRRSLPATSTPRGILINIGTMTSFGILSGILTTVTQFGRTLTTTVYSSSDSIEVTVTPPRTEQQTDLLAEGVGAAPKSKKRSRDDENDDIVVDSERIDSTLTKFKDGVSAELLAETRKILSSLLLMRGPGRERVVQSYGLFHRKLRDSDAEKRLLLAFSLNAGVACRVAALKRCLGEGWADGILTTEEEVDGIGKLSLPLTTEGSVSAEFGNRPITIVSAVVLPIVPGS